MQLIIDKCKTLSNTDFKQSKPGEVTASKLNKSFMRTRSHRSTYNMLNVGKGDRFSKLVEPKTFRRYLSSGGIAHVPDSFSLKSDLRKERTNVPVSS